MKGNTTGMSKVYIRSQNKESLYNLDNSQGIIYSAYDTDKFQYIDADYMERKEKHYVLLLSTIGAWHKLGEYKNKERCLEIIDEIQEECGKYLYADGCTGLLAGSGAFPPMAATVPRIYKMPEE